MRNKLLLTIALLQIFWSCNPAEEVDQGAPDLSKASWQDLREKARGTTVNFMMWQGNPPLNDYINNFLVPALKKRHGITMELTGGQGPEIVQLVMGEKQAGVEKGQVDIVWINGETFFQLREINGLWGPFVKKLPNSKSTSILKTPL
ncbi:MAG: hypothetical protein U5L96_00955 [Owenweeksia sp.]|nr:hypothetical protein [Owenweeksia sp.]